MNFESGQAQYKDCSPSCSKRQLHGHSGTSIEECPLWTPKDIEASQEGFPQSKVPSISNSQWQEEESRRSYFENKKS